MAKPLSPRHKSFLEILSKKALNISASCRVYGIARSTFYNWLLEPGFREEVENLREGLIDDVETCLLKQIEQGDTTAIIFFLKTRGKHRRYTEVQERVYVNRPETESIDLTEGELDDIVLAYLEKQRLNHSLDVNT